jgi:hypothetical protein
MQVTHVAAGLKHTVMGSNLCYDSKGFTVIWSPTYMSDFQVPAVEQGEVSKSSCSSRQWEQKRGNEEEAEKQNKQQRGNVERITEYRGPFA